MRCWLYYVITPYFHLLIDLFTRKQSYVIAAVAASRCGKTVLLVEPGKMLGGMTTGGLGKTDIGNKQAITGLSRQFYKDMGRHYGIDEQWTFEPHVALDIMQSYIKEAKLVVVYEKQISGVKKSGTVIQRLFLKDAEHPGAGTLAAALMENAPELLAKDPVIEMVDLPSDSNKAMCRVNKKFVSVDAFCGLKMQPCLK